MAYQAKYWNGSAWVAVANASFDTSGLVKTTGNTGTVDLSGATVVKGAGMDLIVPTSVTGGTFSASGAISFSAATAVNVNGCFTSAYDNYLLNMRVSGSGDDFVSWRLRASGTDVSGANYDWNYLIVDSAVNVPSRSINQTSMRYGRIGTSVGTSQLFISGPALSAPTHSSNTVIYGLGISQIFMTGYHSLATSYDGISFIPTTGNLTGTLRIYGYHN